MPQGWGHSGETAIREYGLGSSGADPAAVVDFPGCAGLVGPVSSFRGQTRAWDAPGISHMTQIVSEDQAKLEYPPDRVWAVLVDFAGYPDWWPRATHVRVIQVEPALVGSVIEVRPYGGQPFCCTVERVEAGSELVLCYSGFYRGTGRWRLGAGADGCVVSYRIELEITAAWLRWLAVVLPVARLHSRLMREVFRGLAARCGRR
jgi:ribosome-associated toxin RatA of RatAB toxin-antitoxin module